MSSVPDGPIAYEHEKRDGSACSPTIEAESGEIDPIRIADHRRDELRVTLDWMPIAAEYEANLEDQGASTGINATRWPLDRFTVGADPAWTRNKNVPETATTTVTGPRYPDGVDGPLPDIENQPTRPTFQGAWAPDKNSDVRLDGILERLRATTGFGRPDAPSGGPDARPAFAHPGLRCIQGPLARRAAGNRANLPGPGAVPPLPGHSQPDAERT